MPHFRKYLDSKTFGVGDLPDPAKDFTVRIVKVDAGRVSYADGPSKKPMIHLEGVAKPYAAGSTVCTTIANLYGTDDTDGWAGKLVTFYATKCKMKGELVDCLRVRNVKPKDSAQSEPATEPYDLDGALERIAATKTVDELGALRVALTKEKPPADARPALKAAIDEHIAWLAQVAKDDQQGA